MSLELELARIETHRDTLRNQNPARKVFSSVARAAGGLTRVGLSATAAGARRRAGVRHRRRRKTKGGYRRSSGVRFSNAEVKMMLQMYTFVGLMGAIRH